MKLGAVVGLEAEARLLRPWNIPVAVGGGTAAGAAEAAARLRPAVDALLSFGLAGALDPALRPGDLVIPARVVDADGAWDTDEALSALLGPRSGTLLGGGAVLATAAAKRHAHARFAAIAVDLESAAVARAAGTTPFAVLRAICDGPAEPLPRAALVALDGAGRIGPLRILAAVLRHPAEIPALVSLGRHAALARRALQRRVRETRLP